MVRYCEVKYSQPAFFALAIAFGLMGAAMLPHLSDAQTGGSGGGPHPLCVARETACKARAKEQGQDPDTVCPPELKAVVCKELKCEGFCVYGTMMCQGVGCSGNKAGDGDKASGMPQIPEMPKPPEKQGGNEQPKNDMNNLDNCIVDPTSSSSPPKKINRFTGQPCTSENTSATTLLGDAFNLRGAEGETSGSKIKDIANDILSSLGFGGGSQNATTTSAQATTTEGTTASTTVGASSAGGGYVNEETVQTENGVTVRASGYDASTKTGIAGFFGRLFSQKSLAPGDTFLGRLCKARPWQASFMTQLFSPSFFDSLCKRQGYVVGGAGVANANKNQNRSASAALKCPASAPLGGDIKIEWDCAGSTSSGVGFDTKGRASGNTLVKARESMTYALSCGNGKRARCSTAVATPRVHIVAQPMRPALNARSTVYWTSESVSDCTITGPGMKERGLKGAATTIPILNAVTFTIVCSAGGGVEVKDSVTIDVGP